MNRNYVATVTIFVETWAVDNTGHPVSGSTEPWGYKARWRAQGADGTVLTGFTEVPDIFGSEALACDIAAGNLRLHLPDIRAKS